MAELRAELSGRLDAGHLLDQFLGADGQGGTLGGPASQLSAISSPVTAEQLGGISGGAAGIDLSSLTAAIGRLAERLGPLVASLPGPADVVAPLVNGLTLVERVATGDLATQLQSLGEKLSQDVSGRQEGDALSALLGIGQRLLDLPEAKPLLDLLTPLLQGSGGQLPAVLRTFQDLVPALGGTFRVVGSLMALESLLAEAERLMGVMADQLDPETIAPRADGLIASLGDGPGSLTDLLNRLDPADPEAVGAALAAVGLCGERLVGYREALAAAMGLGEATLVYLDVDAIQREMQDVAASIHGVDLDPVERLCQALAGWVDPVLAIDPASLPSFTLEELLHQLETRMEGYAASIRGADLEAVVRPLTDALGAVRSPLDAVAGALDQVTSAVRAALEQVRQLVAALPIDDVTGAIHAVLEPIVAVLDQIRALIADVESALHAAVTATTTALTAVEQAVDQFQGLLEGFFGEAKTFVDQLHLDQVLGQVGDGIRAFRDVLAKAQMQPYFDTAVGAIGTATGVISAVPFGLLPDSMKSEVDAAVQPVKEVDATAVQQEIESLLQVTEGRFQLRDDLEGAVATIQQAYQQLLDAVAQLDPHQYLARIDAALGALAQKIREIQPGLTLQPVQEAIDAVKGPVAGLDLAGMLAPVNDAFAQVLAALEQYSPERLIAPLEERVRSARENLVGEVKLREWGPWLDSLAEVGPNLLRQLEPTRLQPLIQEALEEAGRLLDQLPDLKLSSAIGNLVAQLLSGGGARVYPASFDTVMGWLVGGSATEALTGRAAAIADSVARTQAAVQAADPGALATALAPSLQSARAAIARLPDGSEARTALQRALDGLGLEGILAELATNRARYQASLQRSAGLAETLRRTGLSEADVAARRLQAALAPLRQLVQRLRGIVTRLGLSGLADGPQGLLRTILAAAPADRLAGLTMPLFAALQDQLVAVLTRITGELKGGVDDLLHIVDAVDLGPLQEGIGQVQGEVRGQIEALQPSRLLAEPLAAVEALKAEVAAFDPLGEILSILAALQSAIERILGKLQAEKILATPLQIYDEILGQLRSLNITGLLSPVLDELDSIAQQVDQGLTRTVQAFQQLQAALPGGGGGSTLAVATSVGIG